MRVIDLGFGAVAIEPAGFGRDSEGSLDADALRDVGVSEASIEIYERFGRTGAGSQPYKPAFTASSATSGSPEDAGTAPRK